MTDETGTAINMPAIPKNDPKTVTARKVYTGGSPTELPTTLG